MSVPGTPAPSGSTPHDTVDPTGGEQDSLISGRIRAMVRRMLHNGFPVSAWLANGARVAGALAKTNTTIQGPFMVMSQEAAGSGAGLNTFLVGGATQAARHVQFQTFDETGSVNAGVLDLQPYGGTLAVPLGTVGVVLATFTANTDFWNATALTAGTWFGAASLNFTTHVANSTVMICVSGCINVGAASATNVGAQLLIDNVTAIPLAGGYAPAGGFTNALAGAGAVAVNNLAAGAHTVELDVDTLIAGSAYCRASTQSRYESLRISVIEWKA